MSCLWMFFQIKPRIDWVKGGIGSWTGRKFLSWSKEKNWKKEKAWKLKCDYTAEYPQTFETRHMSINLTTCLIESIRLSGWNYHILSYYLHFISFQEGPFHDRSFPLFFWVDATLNIGPGTLGDSPVQRRSVRGSARKNSKPPHHLWSCNIIWRNQN